MRQGGIRCWCHNGVVSRGLSLGVRGSRLTCQGKRDRGTLDWGIQQWVVHRRGEPNGEVRGSIWLGLGWKSNPRRRCSVDGGGWILAAALGLGQISRQGFQRDTKSAQESMGGSRGKSSASSSASGPGCPVTGVQGQNPGAISW